MRQAGDSESIAVVLGGLSAEHDVSLVSGRAIANALAGRGHAVEAWLIDLDGGWWRLPATALDTGIPQAAYDAPGQLGGAGPFRVTAALDHLSTLAPRPLVFPALHGPFGEDGTIQALLESAGLIYCGSGVAASAIGMDKSLFKRVCVGLGVPVAPWIEVRAGEYAGDQPAALSRIETFARALPDPRIVVKPAHLGSSIGVSIVHRPDEPPELEDAVTTAFRYDDLALVEAYLPGARELEAAVVGNDPADLEVFGPGEVIPGREFYDYEAKYRSTASRTLTHPDLEPAVREHARSIAREVYLAVGASGFGRIDFLLGHDGHLVVSEINTIPGFTPISLFPMLCADGGYGFADICQRILDLAVGRGTHRPMRRLTRADLP